jgi:glycosyltransferase involved in cell wall biosynthesis
VAARAPVPSALTYAFLKRFHGPASAVMVTTQSIANDLSKRGFKNIAYWTKGVDCDVFRPIPGGLENLSKPILLYAGRISVEKNLEAFLKLPIKGSKVIVGDGPYLNKLKKDFPDAVFTGRLSGDDLSRAYSAADVFVFPSLTDTFGLVLAEALACGTPISAFDVAGPRDILSIQDKKLPVGVLDDDLQKAIEKCLSLSIPADRCRKFVLDNYTWKIATDQFLARPGIAVSYSGPK